MGRLDYLRTIDRDELSWARIWDALTRRLTDIPYHLTWWLGLGTAKESKAQINAVRDIHRGERCFVVANGPSLRKMDLSLLKAERTIGMNRIYRVTEQMGFRPSYLAVMDLDSQLEQIAPELASVDIPKFLNWNAHHLFAPSPLTTYLKMTFRPRFSTSLAEGVWGGHSVTYVCLQLAYWLGFKEVILIGKDHDYEHKGVPGKVLVADGKEQNHAMPGYYAPGQTWRIPDYKGEELAYRMARAAFEADGRRVLDATVGGKLTVFPKVDFKTLF